MLEGIGKGFDVWSAALLKKSSAGRGSNGKTAAYGVKKLRELILELAVLGRVVPQQQEASPLQSLEQFRSASALLAKELGVRPNQTVSTQVDMPFRIPVQWRWMTLGDLGIAQTGTTPSKSDQAAFGGGIPFIKPADILPTSVNYANESLTRDGAEKGSRLVPRGSLLMVCIGTIGKCNVVERECAFNQQINALTPSEYVDPHYLLIACRAPYFQDAVWRMSSSTTIAIVNKGRWKSMPVPIPPLAEQHRIVAKVDELMARCDALEAEQSDSMAAHARLVECLLGTLTAAEDAQNFAAAWRRIADHFDTLFTTEHSIDQLKQCILQLAVMGRLVAQHHGEPALQSLEQFRSASAHLAKELGLHPKQTVSVQVDSPFRIPANWRWMKLGDLGIAQTGTTPSKVDQAAFGGEIPFIKPADILPTSVNYSNESLTRYGAEKGSRLVPRGTLLMVCIGTIGKCNLVDMECAFNQQINAITPTEYVDPRYLLLACRAPYFQDAVWSMSSSTTIAIVNKGRWMTMPVPLPPLAEQHRIVAKVDDLMALCDALKARLGEAQTTQVHLADAVVSQAIA